MQKVEVNPHRDARQTARVLAALALFAAFAGCRESSATQKVEAAQQGVPQANVPEVLATVGDSKITLTDIRTRAGSDLDLLETQYQVAKSKIIGAALDSLIRERTVVDESKKTGKTIDELVKAEGGSGLEPTDIEITTWYNENQNRVSGRPLDQVKPQIVDYLRSVRRHEAEQKLEARVKAERKVVVTYQPFRLQFANDGAPTLGKKDAPVTLVEFSDFQCPFCQRMAPTMKEVAQKFPDQVRIIYRQYPLTNIHPFAFKAAEASLCANEQGKFWEIHDVMFQDQKKLAVSDLKETAKRLGMDEKKFNSCLDTGRYVEQIQKDSKEAQRAGVTGTPAIFVNGIVIDGGAVPFDVVQAAIQRELSRANSGR